MIVIHYPSTYKALDGFMDAFNQATKKSTEKIRSGAVLTAKELIRIYGISLLKTNGYQHIDANHLPTLQTNNRQLAKLVKCSSRTIQRHLIKLQAAGIITSKTFHGSNANFEVLINPKILLIKQQRPVENLKKQVPKQFPLPPQNPLKTTFLESPTTNCPHTYSGDSSNKINNIIIAVDNSSPKNPCDKNQRSSLPVSNQINSGDISSNNSGDTGEIAKVTLKKQEKFEENIKNAGEIASRVDKLDDTNLASDPTRDNSLSLYSSLLWLMARNLLYKEVDLTERQISIAKSLIRKLYEPASTDHLSKVHLHYVERIAMVSKYIKKDPLNRYVPLPYKYFDTNNPKGFVGTKKWYLAEQLHKKEVEKELILKRVIRKYVSNQQKAPSMKKPPIQLFRECENTIGKLKDASLTQRFHAAVLHHETYKQLQQE